MSEDLEMDLTPVIPDEDATDEDEGTPVLPEPKLPDIDHLRLSQVLSLRTPEELQVEFAVFEEQLEQRLEPLNKLLNQIILSTDVTDLNMHVATVESYRNRVVRYWALTHGFIEHGKSSRFLRNKIKGQTEMEREAFRRGIVAGFVALEKRLAGLLDTVDHRINLVKKITGAEDLSLKYGHQRRAG